MRLKLNVDNNRRSFEGLRELALFAGAGGGILGGHLLGWRTVCAVERDKYAAAVLAARQNDGTLRPFPIWDDVRTFDGKPWKGRVDVVSGGFPCQDISAAGKGKGIEGERSGLWKEFSRILHEVGPRYAFVENSPILTVRGIHVVLGDLAEMGYDAAWGVLGADDVGAPHVRKRIWIVAQLADADNGRPRRWQQQSERGESAGHVADASCERQCEQRQQVLPETKHAASERGSWWSTEPAVGRVVDRLAYRVDRLRAIGNGQVPAVAARAFEYLYTQLNLVINQ